jgi:hypothetical protein
MYIVKVNGEYFTRVKSSPEAIMLIRSLEANGKENVTYVSEED